MNKFVTRITLVVMCMFAVPMNIASSEEPIAPQTTEEAAAAQILDNTAEVLFGAQQRNSRNSAVKVEGMNGGHGSGTYVEMGDHFAVITARHVVDDNEVYYIVTPSGEKVVGQVVWKSQDKDMAVLKIPVLSSRSPVRIERTNNLNVGDTVLYTGYPASYELLTSRATVSGHARDYHNATLLQGFVWFGYSGSGAFDTSGRLRAIVVAIGVERFNGRPQPLESIVYTFEISRSDVAAIRESL